MENLVLEIISQGVNGEGIAKVDGKVVFVPFSLPNDLVKASIEREKSRFVEAKLEKVVKVSENRVNPPCPYFMQCGGCVLQHQTYETQLKFKQNLVEETLQKIARIKVDVLPTIPSEKQYGYRNKISFVFGENNNGKLSLGFYKINSKEFIEIKKCFLVDNVFNKIKDVVLKFCHENNLKAFNNKTGDLKNLIIREINGSFLITILANKDLKIKFAVLKKELEKFLNKFSLFVAINNKNSVLTMSQINKLIYGDNFVDSKEGQIAFSMDNMSFCQVNNDIKNKLYNYVIKEIPKDAVVIDAFSGAGVLSAMLAKVCSNVVAVEIVKEATQAAEQLKKANDIKNLTNINGDCTKILPNILKEYKNQKICLVLDPPRKGIGDSLANVIAQSKNISQIIYISCDPISLAKDLKILSEKYEIQIVQPFDMFPQTAKPETVVKLFERV